jgi:hypothetical protein
MREFPLHLPLCPSLCEGVPVCSVLHQTFIYHGFCVNAVYGIHVLRMDGGRGGADSIASAATASAVKTSALACFSRKMWSLSDSLWPNNTTSNKKRQFLKCTNLNQIFSKKISSQITTKFFLKIYHHNWKASLKILLW